MASKKAASRKLPRVANVDTSLYARDAGFDALDEDIEDAPYERLSDGCLELSSGGFLRMRPPGFGPDFESDTACFD
jgi:hypothetical protein